MRVGEEEEEEEKGVGFKGGGVQSPSVRACAHGEPPLVHINLREASRFINFPTYTSISSNARVPRNVEADGRTANTLPPPRPQNTRSASPSRRHADD